MSKKLEGSIDDSCDSDFFNSSLSIWRGSKASLEGEHEPINLDLHTACSIGNYDCVRAYINAEYNLNAKNSGGWTPLMYAGYIGHDTIVNLLLEATVDVNLSNDSGLSPLMLAASCGNESVCYFLKEAGSDLENRDKKGWTALFHAAVNGHANIVKFLLENEANVNHEEPKYGYTPLMYASLLGHEIIVHTLLHHGANQALTSRTGETARSLAFSKFHTKIVSLLDERSKCKLVRAQARITDDSSSSDDGIPARHNKAKGRRQRLNHSIADGPEAIAGLISKSQVKFQEPASIKDGAPAMMRPINVGTANPIVKQVNKPAAETPRISGTVHELLEQLNLQKYEQIFIEQDVDLEVFLTLNDKDLQEIGIKLFGPRRKMTHAILNWPGEPSRLLDTRTTNDHEEQRCKQELDKTKWELKQAYAQLAGYHSNISNYHKELENEKNIRTLTENYLINEKRKFECLVKQCKESEELCSKALQLHRQLKNTSQLLKDKSESRTDTGGTSVESVSEEMSRLQTGDSTELINKLQLYVNDASKLTGTLLLNLQKIISDATNNG